MSSPTPRRQLRPRQAKAVGGPSADPIVPGTGRVTRSAAARAARADGDTEDSDDEPLTAIRNRKRRAPQGNRRSKRAQHQAGFYQEGEHSDVEEYRQPSPEVEVAPRTARPRRTARVDSESTTEAGQIVKAPRKTPRKFKFRPAIDDEPVDPNAIIPDWASLPYFVWVNIFQHASPLDDRCEVSWLVEASLLCRALSEPALTALYECPPLLTRSMAHKLVPLVQQDPSTTTFNYRQKVLKLKIDVQEIVAKNYRGKPLDLQALVAHLPRLAVIDFTHPKDAPPYRLLDDNLRWCYPAALFDGLAATEWPGPDGQLVQTKPRPTQLTGWRWNRRLMGPAIDLAKIEQLHLTKPMASLKKISFVNYQVPSLHELPVLDEDLAKVRDYEHIAALGRAIRALPKLEHLSIETSTVVSDHLLRHLPKGLKSIEFISCWELTGEGFRTFLETHGHRLEHLNLHHNQSMNLSFLPVLGESCPNLKTFVMDFKNYNHHEFYKDSDPMYAEVLNPSQVPVWPITLEVLELRNMKKWTCEAAEVLFKSLVDSAPNLPALRYIFIKAMLDDILYRERSAVRDKWRAKFKRVFLRKKEDPKPFYSLRELPPIVSDIVEQPEEREGRRSSRIAAQLSNPSSRASSLGKDMRGGRISYREVDSDDDADGNDNSDDYDDLGYDQVQGEETLYRQGMCDTVYFQLDNQTPVETTLDMADFMDASDGEVQEDPFDVEWNGDAQVPNTTLYAW
ncbi:hypothetical protein OQA88_12227 [Cercophora sp. LCS_1]